MQRGKIQRFGLEPCFDYILIEEEFGVGKPDERVYLHAIGQLDTHPSKSWMVGDNPRVGGSNTAETGHLLHLG